MYTYVYTITHCRLPIPLLRSDSSRSWDSSLRRLRARSPAPPRPPERRRKPGEGIMGISWYTM